MSDLYEVIRKEVYVTVGVVDGRKAATKYAMDYFDSLDDRELEKMALIREYIGVELPWQCPLHVQDDSGDAFIRPIVGRHITKREWSQLDLLDRGIIIGWLISFGMLALLLALLLKR